MAIPRTVRTKKIMTRILKTPDRAMIAGRLVTGPARSRVKAAP